MHHVAVTVTRCGNLKVRRVQHFRLRSPADGHLPQRSMMLRLSAALALGALQLARAQPAEDIGKLVLDEQQLNFTGTLFDTERWAGYVRCMRQASEGAGFSIYEVEEAGWRGFVEYGLSNGSRSDPWDPDLGDPRRGGWLEYNPQVCSVCSPAHPDYVVHGTPGCILVLQSGSHAQRHPDRLLANPADSVPMI